MTWGTAFRTAYGASSERSRLAVRTVIERIALPAAGHVSAASSDSDNDAAIAFRQAAQALAKADALLAPLRLTDPTIPPAADAATAQPPTVEPHDHFHSTGHTTP